MPSSLMHHELFETPARLRAQHEANTPTIETLAVSIATLRPARWFVVGRGTSDHAGAYLGYAAGLLSGHIVADLSPSLMTVYARRLRFDDALLIAISQSGAGSDINHVVSGFAAAGGTTLALTNEPDSELARRAQHCLALRMGPEKAVAATKTFLGTLAALTQLLARLGGHAALEKALFALPDRLAAAGADTGGQPDLSLVSERPASMFVIGRGIGLAVAREIALKCKEVCAVHAEAYSAAEFRHGPFALVGPDRPVIVLCLDDETRPQLLELAKQISALGAPCVLIGPGLPAMPAASPIKCCALPTTGSVYTDAILMTFALYAALEHAAVASGLDPDAPPHITKVTSTY